ncbi:type VI secretion system ATPase TssH [Citrobacter freundii]|uniref:type VI secretion system ATPase TssH n=1 Tax=Citrobacter TaxID=544 RepID=UPI00155FCA7F|nr:MULTISPECIES: type VI secretion system ATPase TssH [Citrobacter]NRF57531.1 type VI secretion system ATPase TssH [Citrobacter braakii]QMA44142.1 type VI secretion system ATPase TssH [Citrobacter freundii]MCB6778487.1 type VI secretion system ATPase TssH [Citrobacter sp. 210820-DFI.7.8]MCB6788472.1 type VI secretion system ATPase TssH [Citrobacter sp. 210820-DFI.7.7]MCB8603078.1 type VI secretion system ATPase TssH [Citrobacter europaeus]
MDLKALVQRLNPVCFRALEQAAERSRAQGHWFVEPEHLLLALLDDEHCDLAYCLSGAAISVDTLREEIHSAQAQFKSGCTRMPVFSVQLVELLEGAVLLAAFQRLLKVRSALLLQALLTRERLRAQLAQGMPLLLQLPAGVMESQWQSWCRGSVEELSDTHTGEHPEREGGVLDQYTHDLTRDAREGLIDPIIGRDAEIRQCIDILLRRRQNNPILVGAPGVGKTAVAEGLARRIAEGSVPPPLRDVALLSLDLGLLQAGAGVKGEFEQRLKGVIDAVKKSPQPIILFIDEAHTLIGAGGAEGGSDAANLLKPALARGELRTIAATTWQEYKKYFEKDPALDRRFQRIQIEEPDENRAVVMLRAVADKLEAHHGVQILDTAIREAVRLSQRYISGRQLPDKAISVLDTACARVALAQHDVPPLLEEIRQQQAAIEEESERLNRELLVGVDHHDRLCELEALAEKLRLQAREVEGRWQDERQRVGELLATRQRMLDLSGRLDDDEELEQELVECAALIGKLETTAAQLRDEVPLVPDCVDPATVAAVIGGWTGIPLGQMLTDEAHALRTLVERMSARVMGQQAALETIAQRLRAYRSGLTDPQKPVGVFLLVGPTGVGKTETAYALADALYGGERNLITINLSEYQEAHTVSQLKGAPPGYVGYGSGGALTEAVRRRPYSVVLLDEIEKAHPDVLEAFYNVFDKGVMEDGTGLIVDFKNTVMLATSNVGAELILDTPAAELNSERFNEALREELLRHFRPAFLARMTTVAYRALDEEILKGIVLAKLEKLSQRYFVATGEKLNMEDGLVERVMEKCKGVGARDVENLVIGDFFLRFK